MAPGGPPGTPATLTQDPRPETVPFAPARPPWGWDADVQVKAPRHYRSQLSRRGGRDAGGGGGAFSWLSCHLIRAIIRLGLQDGAVRALPPLARGREGAGSPDRRLPGPQLLRCRSALGKRSRRGVWRRLGPLPPSLSQADSLLDFYFLATNPALPSSVALGKVTELL